MIPSPGLDHAASNSRDADKDAGSCHAVVNGKPYDAPPSLYIPPEALKVLLTIFEGPLDLLLYLIYRHHLDILEISITTVADQYLEYIDLMQEMNVELASEYLLMAAVLLEIKSRALLPAPLDDPEEEEDPRMRLAEQLREYERFKRAAEMLDALPRVGRDTFTVHIETPWRQETRQQQPSLEELLAALRKVTTRSARRQQYRILGESLKVETRMSEILTRLPSTDTFTPFTALLSRREGRLGLVVTFLAIMELTHNAMIEIRQLNSLAQIYIRRRPHRPQ